MLYIKQLLQDLKKLSILVVLSAMIIASPLLITSNSHVAEASPQVPPRASLGVPFDIAVNQTVAVAGSDVSVTFLNITEDSRCPSDVVCIWAGQVTAMVGLTQNSTDLGRFNLTLGAGSNSSMADQEVGSYRINLTQVQPYPMSSQPTLPSDYVATLVLSRENGTSTMARSALVMAVGNSTEAGITAFIASWSIERENGVAIVVMRDENMSLSRTVARFVPTDVECVNTEMTDCIDGNVTSVSGDAGISEGDTIHFEIDGDKTMIQVTYGSDEQELEIRKMKEVSKPLVT